MKTKAAYQPYLLITVVIALLFQSCSIYNISTVDIDTEAASTKKVKIYIVDKERLKFKKVIKENNAYYGINQSGKRIVLKQERIKKIRLYNKNATIVTNILVPALTLAFIVWIGVLVTNTLRDIATIAPGSD